MSTYTPFLCPVTPYGTPFFVSLEASSDNFAMNNISAEELCFYYWLLESVTIHYKLIFSGSLEVEGNLVLGGMYGTVPRMRLLDVPNFSGTIFHSASGLQAEGSIDFSTIDCQVDGLYAVNFAFNAYDRIEGIGGSNCLLSFYRSVGSTGQRNSHQSQAVNFLGKRVTIYLNYNNQIWSEDEIELNEFSLAATFFSNEAAQ
jgi:hypothetical protein